CFAIFPGYRQRPPRPPHQGGRLRMRRYILRPCRPRAVCRGLRGHRRAGQIGRFCFRLRCRLLWLAAEPGNDHPHQAGMGRSATLPLRGLRARALPGGRTDHLACHERESWMNEPERYEAELMARRLATAPLMSRRFRGFLPVVIDVETGGFHAATDALLEIAAVMIEMDADGTLRRGPTHNYHVKPFEGARLDPSSLSITGIDPYHPLRPALPERDALQRIFREIRHAIRDYHCRRAILVGHNAAFDLGFLNAAISRAEVKRNPFHPFSCFDTATFAGAALGQTVLAKAVTGAGLKWDSSSAHSAAYDAERTA